MNKVKVLMIGSDNSVKGGITEVIIQLLKHDWETKNVEMRFLPTFIEGSHIKRIFFFIKSYLCFITTILRYKPDIVHIHMSHNGSFYRKFIIHKTCRVFKKRHIIHLHSSEFKIFYEKGTEKRKKRIRSLLRGCDRVFVLGNKWNETILRIEPEAKSVVLNNTVALPDLERKNRNGVINILFLGVLVERKGVIDLLKVADKLNRSGILADYQVKFKIGGTGSEEFRLKQYVETNNLSNYVDFLGWVSGQQKKNYLADSQIFILPSYNEGLPIAILEAISWGLPVISTKVGSIDEAVIDNYNGFLVYPGDVYALERALKNIILDEKTRLIFGGNSRILAEKKFNDKFYYQTINNTYRQILEEHI
ncbi:glycosyltransferase family 4 protein [Heyndrickxia ginsengihumi]|uniref:glycosyltransferase family 4 protein n=1 Tax=Heyndrickxia ginsengihumi TaxID=363870 RepID=UPI003D22934A